MKFGLYLIKRSIEFWWQRRTRGFDSSECWSLDFTISKWLVPRLKVLRKMRSRPGNLTAEEWDDILDNMIATFEFLSSDDFWSKTYPDFAEKGLDDFRNYFHDLWY